MRPFEDAPPSVIDSLTLISANPAYARREISNADLDTVKIEGRVIAVLHRE